jgi:redox-sensitive bicupin YhaK (pirin superfamily)
VLEGTVSAAGQALEPGWLGYLGTGRVELVLGTRSRARVLLIGGEPFREALIMWWNYVARTREEITAAHRSWVSDDDRFGSVPSPLERIITEDPPWAPH